MPGRTTAPLISMTMSAAPTAPLDGPAETEPSGPAPLTVKPPPPLDPAMANATTARATAKPNPARASGRRSRGGAVSPAGELGASSARQGVADSSIDSSPAGLVDEAGRADVPSPRGH